MSSTITVDEYHERKAMALAECGRSRRIVFREREGSISTAVVSPWIESLEDLRLNHRASLLAGRNSVDGYPPMPEDFDEWAQGYVARNPRLAHLLPQDHPKEQD